MTSRSRPGSRSSSRRSASSSISSRATTLYELEPAPGKRLVLDVFNPNLRALLGHDGVEHEDTSLTALPDGRTFRRAYRVSRVRWLDQVNDTELIYYVSPSPGAPAARYVQAFVMRWFLREELSHLLARGGFSVDAFHGDFDRSPLDDGSPEIVVTARRRNDGMECPPPYDAPVSATASASR